MAWFFILALVACLVGCIYWAWSIWQSRFAGRTMEFDSREFALIAQARADLSPEAEAEAKQGRAERTAQNATTVYVPPVEMPVAPATPDAHGAGQAGGREGKSASRPAALLDSAAQALYLDLRAAVGAYPLLACVDVAALLRAPDVMPPRVQADFVICRKDFTPVVAIFLDRTTTDPQRERALQLLKQSRLRVLHWNAASPPSREDMHHAIFKQKKEESAERAAP